METLLLRNITDRIEQNKASLDDYHTFEKLLNQGGLSHDFVQNYLNKAGFLDWKDFYNARLAKKNKEIVEGVVVGGLLGMATAVIINAIKSS